MPNFDDFKLAVESLSGGTNSVILDDIGMPSVMVAFPKLKNSEIIAGGSENTHPAFIVNGTEHNAVYVSKFQNIVLADRAYSLPMKDPKVYVNFDTSVNVCRNKGANWGLMPYSLWAAIALWSRKNGTIPRGNNNYGRDHAYNHEKGIEISKDSAKTARIATGSGPATWNHNWLPDGIADLNGNVNEWVAGLRTIDGEINIIPYANAMDAEVSMSATSTAWKAINAFGAFVNPGSTGTIKYNENMKLTTGTIVKQEKTSWPAFHSLELAPDLGAAPEILKVLALYPDEPGTDYGGDTRGVYTSGERVARCGGNWDSGANAGVFYGSLSNVRGSSGGDIGFRTAYYGDL